MNQIKLFDPVVSDEEELSIKKFLKVDSGHLGPE